MPHPNARRGLFLLPLLLLLAGCLNMGDRREPLPTLVFPATAEPAGNLVVVLPGRWDDNPGMAETGIAEAIRQAWPQTDVLLVEAKVDYYRDGRLAERLHRQVIAPARQRGYREIWLVGASMGGLGSLLYERRHPGEVEGIVLLAPFLGDRGLFEEIAASGGVAAWDPGPPPPEVTEDNYQRDLWRHLQTWLAQPERSARVWLAYGSEDRLREAVPVFAPLIRKQQILERPGGHTWTVWVPAAQEIFERARGAAP